jgi:N-glycosylase/DNA lyase
MSLTHSFVAPDYSLDVTFTSGQAFRWKKVDSAWTGVVGNQWVRLRQEPGAIIANTAIDVTDWDWLVTYLQLATDWSAIVNTFPADEAMARATQECRGLRLLKQYPWECLASFLMSSTKQIVQIQQIVDLLCERYGEPVPVPPGFQRTHAFPTAQRIARCTEVELRTCKMGFRAPYLLGSARMIASGEFDLSKLGALPADTARLELEKLPGVGRKIADCVLLFAYGFPTAFPVDVWILKALRQLYFGKRRPTVKKLHQFAGTYFGPYGGYAQQYLFHYMRTVMPRSRANSNKPKRATR